MPPKSTHDKKTVNAKAEDRKDGVDDIPSGSEDADSAEDDGAGTDASDVNDDGDDDVVSVCDSEDEGEGEGEGEDGDGSDDSEDDSDDDEDGSGDDSSGSESSSDDDDDDDEVAKPSKKRSAASQKSPKGKATTKKAGGGSKKRPAASQKSPKKQDKKQRTDNAGAKKAGKASAKKKAKKVEDEDGEDKDAPLVKNVEEQRKFRRGCTSLDKTIAKQSLQYAIHTKLDPSSRIAKELSRLSSQSQSDNSTKFFIDADEAMIVPFLKSLDRGHQDWDATLTAFRKLVHAIIKSHMEARLPGRVPGNAPRYEKIVEFAVFLITDPLQPSCVMVHVISVDAGSGEKAPEEKNVSIFGPSSICEIQSKPTASLHIKAKTIKKSPLVVGRTEVISPMLASDEKFVASWGPILEKIHEERRRKSEASDTKGATETEAKEEEQKEDEPSDVESDCDVTF